MTGNFPIRHVVHGTTAIAAMYSRAGLIPTLNCYNTNMKTNDHAKTGTNASADIDTKAKSTNSHADSNAKICPLVLVLMLILVQMFMLVLYF